MSDHENRENLWEYEDHDDEQEERKSLVSLEDKRRLLGRAIRELRARRGLSQELLGLESDLHRNYVGAMERGEINPTFRVLMKVSRGLGMPLSSLLEVYERNLAEAEAQASARAALQDRIDRTVRKEGEVPAGLEDDEPTPARRLARVGQERAAVHLERLGLRIVERDFRTRWGTVDVIAHDNQRIVFCEVTTRRYGTPAPRTPSDRPHRSVHRTATVWLEQTRSQRPTVPELRFDAIDVTVNAAGELVALQHRVLATERADGPGSIGRDR